MIKLTGFINVEEKAMNSQRICSCSSQTEENEVGRLKDEDEENVASSEKFYTGQTSLRMSAE